MPLETQGPFTLSCHFFTKCTVVLVEMLYNPSCSNSIILRPKNALANFCLLLLLLIIPLSLLLLDIFNKENLTERL